MSTPIAGLLVPLDMFRISQFAAMFSELLASKARNILDAELVVTRHPEAPLFLMQIAGSVIDGNPATFWRENVDLAQMASRALPRQVIMFYADPGETPADRREGFIVAQQGQMIAGDDVGTDRMPADAPDLGLAPRQAVSAASPAARRSEDLVRGRSAGFPSS